MLRLTPLLVLLALVPSACDSAATPAASRGAALRPDLRGATARTLGARSAFFTMTAAIGFQGVPVHTESRGRVSFTSRRAHVYKLVPGDPVPHEEIVDGPLVYANANITAALSDPTQKGWTKLDTRRISADRRLGELDHVRTAVYLPSGALDVHRLGQRDGLVRFRARVAPTRVLAHVPAAERSRVRAILRADYPAAPFAADFWLDGKGRLRRVRVSYRTEKGSTFTLVLRLGAFGVPVDVTPPSAEGTQDITP